MVLFFYKGWISSSPKTEWPYERKFCGKTDREGSCSKAALVRTKSALRKTGTGRRKGGFVKGGFGECTLVPGFVPGEHANVPLFRVFVPGERALVPGFRCGGTSECTLVPVFIPGEHPPKYPFGKPPFCQPPRGGPSPHLPMVGGVGVYQTWPHTKMLRLGSCGPSTDPFRASGPKWICTRSTGSQC